VSRRSDDADSVVYVVQANWGGPIKIGTARRGRIEQRIKELQTGNPSRLVVRQLLPGGRSVETELHERFSHLRMVGEWFECTDEVRNTLDCCWENESTGSQVGTDSAGESEPIYQWSLRSHGRNFRGRLRLIYEVNGSSISDNWYPHELSAQGVWSQWRKWIDRHNEYQRDPERVIPISWYVTSPDVAHFEAAPFTTTCDDDCNWLTHYTWPVNEVTLAPVSWTRITIEKCHWSEFGASKGGFIEELTGWRPSALQQSVSVTHLERAANISAPCWELL
jgi:hypothetical protein